MKRRWLAMQDGHDLWQENRWIFLLAPANP